MQFKGSTGCLVVAVLVGLLGLLGVGAGSLGLVALGVTLLATRTPTPADSPDPVVPATVALAPPAEATRVEAPEPAPPPAPQVRVNGRALTSDQMAEMTRTYGQPPRSGDWWYDAKSGQFGKIGQPVFGILRPGHAFGRLPADASAGRSGVFLNGRQLPSVEVQLYAAMLGPIQPGRYWLDGQGNVGTEGQSAPVANLLVAAAAAGVVNAGSPGGSPADRWLSGQEFSGEARIGGMPMTSGTWDTSGQGNHVISVGGEVLNLPPY